jgi:hypothetical protein
MYFPYVDAFREDGILTIGWRFTDDGTDPWTARFNQAKYGNVRAVRAAPVTLEAAVRTITLPGKVIVVGAISSATTHLEPGDLVWQLGSVVARALKGLWRPDLLQKEVHASLHKLKGGASVREATVNGKYTASAVPPGTTGVAIVDDFVTRGNTFTEITRALRASAQVRDVWGIALGKTENVNWEGNAGISNQHVPERLATLWDNVP